jgi:hypothetical protein
VPVRFDAVHQTLEFRVALASAQRRRVKAVCSSEAQSSMVSGITMSLWLRDAGLKRWTPGA